MSLFWSGKPMARRRSDGPAEYLFWAIIVTVGVVVAVGFWS